MPYYAIVLLACHFCYRSGYVSCHKIYQQYHSFAHVEILPIIPRQPIDRQITGKIPLGDIELTDPALVGFIAAGDQP